MRLKLRFSWRGLARTVSMNYKNLNYEIETEISSSSQFMKSTL